MRPHPTSSFRLNPLQSVYRTRPNHRDFSAHCNPMPNKRLLTAQSVVMVWRCLSRGNETFSHRRVCGDNTSVMTAISWSGFGRHAAASAVIAVLAEGNGTRDRKLLDEQHRTGRQDANLVTQATPAGTELVRVESGLSQHNEIDAVFTRILDDDRDPVSEKNRLLPGNVLLL